VRYAGAVRVSIAAASLVLASSPLVAAAQSLAPAATAASPAASAAGSAPASPSASGAASFDADATSAALVEAPPPAPWRKGFVLDSALGTMGFVGEFRRVAPQAIWLHTQLGYELFRWFMVFGEADLAFTDTSNAVDASKARAFPLLGFGPGGRLTVRLGDRVGLYAQGSLGLLKADVANNALAVLGYKNAESFKAYFGARLGLEWYQVDRHFALGATSAIRFFDGFTKTGASRDTPLALDVAASLRYAF